MVADFRSYLSQLILAKLEVFLIKIHIALLVHWYKVDVCMAHLQANYALANLLTGDSRPERLCNLLGEYLQISQFLVAEIKYVVNLALGDNQSVAFCHGVDIEERVVLVILGNLVRGNFARYDA